MKILHTVEKYFPEKGGMQEVVKQLSERMVLLGHSVDVATTKNAERKTTVINGVNIKEFNIHGNAVLGISGKKEEYTDFLKKSDYDIIVNFAAQQWATDLMLDILPEIKGKKVFVPTGFSMLHDRKYSEYYKKMTRIWGNYDLTVFLSNNYQDIDLFRKHKFNKFVIIPNGADEKEFAVNDNKINLGKYDVQENEKVILSVGSHTGQKGHKELIEIYQKLKLENSKLVIIGNTFSESGLKRGIRRLLGKDCEYNCIKSAEALNKKFMKNNTKKEILVLNLDRTETIAFYKRADLFLFPSNIECSPIVLFEACAAGTPFAASSAGNSAEIAEWTEGGIILPTKKLKNRVKVSIDHSAKLVNNMMSDEKLLLRMSERGKENFINKYTWKKIAEKYVNIYTRLINGEKIINDNW